MYVCYLLSDGGRRTYIGITVDLQRRLRQHNGELRGGAKYTRGRRWKSSATSNPSSKSDAMRFEWRYKRTGRGLQGRLRGLGRMLRRGPGSSLLVVRPYAKALGA